VRSSLRLMAVAVGATLLTAAAASPAQARVPTASVRVFATGEVTEGEAVMVSVVLDTAVPHPVTVRVDTRAAQALAPADYRGFHSRVTVPAGQRVLRLRVLTVDDLLDEGLEDFQVRLSAPEGAELAPRHTRATSEIRDDDPLPRVHVVGARFDEPALGHRLGFTQVRLSAPSGRRVVVDLRTREGTATAGQDFVPLRPVAVFDPGATTARVSVELLSDSRVETAETLRLAVTAVRHALATGGATITIDDAAGG
jgi:hypothetical protein